MVSAEEADESVCANCGIAGVDNIKLEECDKCDLVKYCSAKCRVIHREQHQEGCKKRADELHEKRLFTQPDGTHEGECPICFLPLPLGTEKSTFMSCCGQTICMGCFHANILSNVHDRLKASMCAFCRTSALDVEECDKRAQERIEANDPPSLCFMGAEGYRAGDFDKALKYLIKAAELGYADAHLKLCKMYMYGEGIEKDEEKAIYHCEKAAIGGHPIARHTLALCEDYNGNMEKAVKHFIIAANLGYDESMKALLPFYKKGYITKEDYGATLRTHQDAIDATKSSQREVAERRQALIQQEEDRK
jgi:tetratricopeptide (TPR) repeat protein